MPRGRILGFHPLANFWNTGESSRVTTLSRKGIMNKVKQKNAITDSPFGKAWQEANQLFYVAEVEAHRMGVTPPKVEEVVGHLFQLRDDLGNPNDLYQIALSEQLSKLSQEKENE